MLRRLHRRLRMAMLRARVAQLRCAAGAMACSTAAEAVLQAQLLGRAAEAQCELAALAQRRP